MLLAHVNQTVPSLRELNPLVPAWFEDIIRRMLEKTPEHRYSSANEVVKAIESQGGSGAVPQVDPIVSSLAKVPIVIEKKSADAKVHTGRYDGVITQRKTSKSPFDLSNHPLGWGLIVFGLTLLIGAYMFIQAKP